MSENIESWPEEVYLDHGSRYALPDFGDCCEEDIGWQSERTEEFDVKYIRADVVEKEVDRASIDSYNAGYIKGLADNTKYDID